MDQEFEEKLARFKDSASLLKQSLHGLEKECLRVIPCGGLSMNPHPEHLGSALMHPFISTDFSEAQLELIAPPFTSEEAVFNFMTCLHRYLYLRLGEEALWPFSAPCRLENNIPIARYGSSVFAHEKELYRRGLHYRYGSEMQALSGVHYNFSFSDKLVALLGDPSEVYLGTARNYLRYGWLVTYLYGASPVYDASFFDALPEGIETLSNRTVGGQYATSLRMSQHGYYSKLQTQVGVSYDSLTAYIRDLEYAISTPSAVWAEIAKGNQINDHIIQIEAEHYSRIRPKPPPNFRLRPVEALKEQGIRYVEVRGLDLDPFASVGITADTMMFLHMFLILCTLKESRPLNTEEQKHLTTNQNLVAMEGRRPLLKMQFNGQKRELKTWAFKLLTEMEPIATLLDQTFDSSRYSAVLQDQRVKVDDPDKTPSAAVLEQSLQSSFCDYGSSLAREYRESEIGKGCPDAFLEKLDLLAKDSLEKQHLLEQHDDFILKGYEDLELSTQAILREAFKRGVEVDALDRRKHLFRLKKGDHVEIIKNGTMTSRDSLISYFLMENKEASKKILAERGLSVPKGGLFTRLEDAVAAFETFGDRKVVVKPNETNYGIGVTTVEAHSRECFNKALHHAFRFGDEVMIEEFIKGDEYRFLVIDKKIVAVCKRIPANIVGDGLHTVAQLIEQKNRDPKAYKVPKYSLRMGEEERLVLGRQGLNFESIPSEGARIFIRDNSNVSTGGDSIDFTDSLHKGYVQIAIEAAEAVQAVFCGVDMMIQDPHGDPTDDNYGIIEVNFNPALWIHRYPTEGSKQYVEKAVLDALGFDL